MVSETSGDTLEAQTEASTVTFGGRCSSRRVPPISCDTRSHGCLAGVEKAETVGQRTGHHTIQERNEGEQRRVTAEVVSELWIFRAKLQTLCLLPNTSFSIPSRYIVLSPSELRVLHIGLGRLPPPPSEQGPSDKHCFPHPKERRKWFAL